MGMGKDTGSVDATADMSQQAFDIGAPAMKDAMRMFQETINTGGVQARQPIYAQAAEKSLQAGNQAKIALGEDMDRSGLAGTPFAEAAEKRIDLDSRQNAAMAPMDMANVDYWKILSTFFPGAGGSMGQGIQGMSNAAGAEAQMYASMNQLLGSLFGSTTGMFAGGENSAMSGMQSMF